MGDGHDILSLRPAALRVVAFGDCNTNTIDEEQGTVPGALKEVISTNGGESTLDNLGFGMSTCREGLWAAQHYDKVADVQLINYGLVDAWETTIPAFYIPYINETRAKRFVRKLLKLTKRRLRAAWLRSIVPTGPVVGPTEFVRNITEMTRLFRRLNPAGEVVIWSTPLTIAEYTRNENIKRYNDLLEQLADREKLVFIDSNATLEKKLLLEEWHIDHVHLSQRAACLIAQNICRQLENRGVLNPATALKAA